MTPVDPIREQAEYLAKLVQGSQAIEGAGLDADGYKRLVDKAEQLLRAKIEGGTSHSPTYLSNTQGPT